MTDFVVFLAVESVALFLLWPKLMERREGFNNRALLSDNPHLRQCYRVWRWTVPTTFLVIGVVAVSQFETFWPVFEDALVMNVAILMFAIVMGTGFAECLGEYYRRHTVPFQHMSHGLKARHG